TISALVWPAPLGGMRELAAAAQGAPSIGVAISGVELDGETRYSVTLAPPDGVDLSKTLVEVFLPDPTTFLRASETPGRTQFLGLTGSTLQWAASFGPDDPIDAFSFFLSEPATS